MSERITDKDLATKVARKRLSVLEMAEALGNVSEACRRSGMDRTSFYEWRRRFQTHGLEGMKDLPPITKSQPNATTPETEAVVVATVNLCPNNAQRPVSAQRSRARIGLSRRSPRSEDPGAWRLRRRIYRPGTLAAWGTACLRRTLLTHSLPEAAVRHPPMPDRCFICRQ